jgi:hypothetical protein
MQESYIINKRKEGEDIEKQIKRLEVQRDMLLVELELLLSHYPADFVAEK